MILKYYCSKKCIFRTLCENIKISVTFTTRSYHRLSLEDRKAYLQLDTWSEDENVCWRDLKAEYVAKNSSCLSEEDLKMHLRIIDIYRVNGCMNGCSIRTSRFNHSCRSNAEATGDGIRVSCYLTYKGLLGLRNIAVLLLGPL